MPRRRYKVKNGNKSSNGDSSNIWSNPSRNQAIFLIRGLPNSCNTQQVVDFFRRDDGTSLVYHGENGVVLVRRSDGRFSGSAFVMFGSSDDAQQARTRQFRRIGSREIEILRSNIGEFRRIVGTVRPSESSETAEEATAERPTAERPTPVRSQRPERNYRLNQGNFGTDVNWPLSQGRTSPQLPFPTQHSQYGVNLFVRKFVKMENLPLEASGEDVVLFLGRYSRFLTLYGIAIKSEAHLIPPRVTAYVEFQYEYIALEVTTQLGGRSFSTFSSIRHITIRQISLMEVPLDARGTEPTLFRWGLIQSGYFGRVSTFAPLDNQRIWQNFPVSHSSYNNPFSECQCLHCTESVIYRQNGIPVNEQYTSALPAWFWDTSEADLTSSAQIGNGTTYYTGNAMTVYRNDINYEESNVIAPVPISGPPFLGQYVDYVGVPAENTSVVNEGPAAEYSENTEPSAAPPEVPNSGGNTVITMEGISEEATFLDVAHFFSGYFQLTPDMVHFETSGQGDGTKRAFIALNSKLEGVLSIFGLEGNTIRGRQVKITLI